MPTSLALANFAGRRVQLLIVSRYLVTAMLLDLVRYPIIQAPMAGVSTPALAAAVSNAGALGSIGIGASSVQMAQRAIMETQSLTSAPFNVNVFCHEPARRDASIEAGWLTFLQPIFQEFEAAAPPSLTEIYRSFNDDEDSFRMLLSLRPPVVSFHFGVPSSERIQALHDAGITTLATATNLNEARRVETAGIHAVIAQGIEAGGHRGHFDPSTYDPGLTTSVLVSIIAREVRIPVIAAGGIMDSRGIRAALSLGASAVQMGTAFILCPESSADATYRAALMSARSYDTRLTTAISGRPARGLGSRFMDIGKVGPPAPSYPVAYDAGKALHAAASAKGNCEFAAHWAGQGAPLAREMPAAKLVEQLVQDLA